MVKYSICITHYNNFPTVERSLESILDQIDTDFEVIVADNFSNDGSEKILKSYSEKERIKLITRRSNRGEGRQIAFAKSKGDYIIANMDLDDIFRPYLKKLLTAYHSLAEGNLLLAITDTNLWAQNITIGPRSLLSSLGGWRNLQYGEDWDIWSRAAAIKHYKYIVFTLAERWNPHPERGTILNKLRFRYVRYRDLLRLGRDIFSNEENISVSQRLIAFLARATLPFQRTYVTEFNKSFDPYRESYLLQADLSSLTS